ncbi:trehalose 6-phosphate synthase [Micromonospora luteifusca]|uniref:Trehalose 6-phosphate synthase n=1 Tax=Micromonospora luteifusca TaxID=709860 RepID=A0ABS2M1K2_9ACTN|nr:trehalose-6-phosphate synthase [Micromonospora luteifusca]MBM7494320.1 trehalose 6-phosphate synthase [Micromonospora luteifusca]
MTARPIVICSNRGPVTAYPRGSSGYDFTRTRPNGLVPTVFPAFARHGGTWVYAARSEADRALAKAAPVPLSGIGDAAPMRLRPLAVPSALARSHYEDFSVGVLARLLHYLHDRSSAADLDGAAYAAWPAYQAVNEQFAAALAEEAAGCPILVQDYHLLLVAAMLRRAGKAPQAPLIYFHHVAWCDPDYFGMLPVAVREALLAALVDFDVVGFHSRRWADAFLACCARWLPGAQVRPDAVRWKNRTCRTVVAPAAIDRDDLLVETLDPRYEWWRAHLRDEAAGRWMLTRVERADLWKNPLRGLQSVERFLTDNPTVADHVWFPWVLTPTRDWMPEYRLYLDDCLRVSKRINAEFGRAGREPVQLFVSPDAATPDRALALAALSVADGVMVTPTFDGLNITAKEAAILSDADPVMIVSENAGIMSEFPGLMISVNPFDVADTAGGIRRAYRMGRSDRIGRSAELRRRVLARTPQTWLNDLLGAVPLLESTR